MELMSRKMKARRGPFRAVRTEKKKKGPVKSLSPSERFILWIGFGYLLMAILASLDIIDIDAAVIACFSTATMLYAVSDVMLTVADWYKQNWLQKTFRFVLLATSYVSTGLSALFIVVLPFIYMDMPVIGTALSNLSDQATLISLGLIMLSLTLKNYLGSAKQKD